MKVRVYSYAKCSTCRRALAFLNANGVEFESLDIVAHPPSVEELEQVLKLSGLPLRRLFNTSGRSYREGGFGERLAKLSQAEALEALSADGKLIKRPVVLAKAFALVGFEETSYRARFGSRVP